MWEDQEARVAGVGLQRQEGNRVKLFRACGLYRGMGVCPVEDMGGFRARE